MGKCTWILKNNSLCLLVLMGEFRYVFYSLKSGCGWNATGTNLPCKDWGGRCRFLPGDGEFNWNGKIGPLNCWSRSCCCRWITWAGMKVCCRAAGRNDWVPAGRKPCGRSDCWIKICGGSRSGWLTAAWRKASWDCRAGWEDAGIKMGDGGRAGRRSACCGAASWIKTSGRSSCWELTGIKDGWTGRTVWMIGVFLWSLGRGGSGCPSWSASTLCQSSSVPNSSSTLPPLVDGRGMTGKWCPCGMNPKGLPAWYSTVLVSPNSSTYLYVHTVHQIPHNRVDLFIWHNED